MTDPRGWGTGLRPVIRLIRTYPGWIVAGAGVVLSALGWYGISGERYVARQLPYLASATIPGAALIIAGALIITRSAAAFDPDSRRRLAELHSLLTEEAAVPDSAPAPSSASSSASSSSSSSSSSSTPNPAPWEEPPAAEHPDPGHPRAETKPPSAGNPSAPGSLLALPHGSIYHRPDCQLIRDKPQAAPLQPGEARGRRLDPCPVCDPPPLPEASSEASTEG